MSQHLAFHRIVKITTSPPDTMTTEKGRIFSVINLTIHSLNSFDQPIKTEIGLFSDRVESLAIKPEDAQ